MFFWALLKAFNSMRFCALTVMRQKWRPFVVVHLPSRVWLFMTPWTTARQVSLSLTISQSLLKLLSIEFMMLFEHLILCHPLLLPSILPSIRVFSNESALHIQWPKYFSFNFSISPSNEYLGLISFKINWFDLLAVQGTLESYPAPQFKDLWWNGSR